MRRSVPIARRARLTRTPIQHIPRGRSPPFVRMHLGAHDLAAPDDLSRFGAHGQRLQRALQVRAIHES